MLAMGITASTMAGATQLDGSFQSARTLMIFNHEASAMIASKPNTKFGMEINAARPTAMVLLNADLGFPALRIPSGIPSPAASNDANKTKRMEYPKRLSQNVSLLGGLKRISCTLRPRCWMEGPRLPQA